MADMLFILLIIAVLAPFVGAFLSLLLKKWASIRDIFSVLPIALSAILSIIAYGQFAATDGTPYWKTFAWADWLNGNLVSGFYLDSLSALMILIVSILSMLIAFFSLEYMKEDKNKARYWFFMQLFVGGMLLLVLAQDMILLFLGWEIVGLCSCFLIGHYFMKKGEAGSKPAKSGIKALIMTGVGDVGFLAFLSWGYFLNLQNGVSNPLLVNTSNFGINPPVFMGILLLFAPLTKSAQFPLQSWLSSGDTVDIDAMHGPTTVSALIHAATMVKAGVYLVARFAIGATPIWDEKVFYIILMVIAGLSCFLAAFGALVTTDIKRVLAYSTISQLSYMFLAFSIRGIDDGLLAGQLHLLSHSIFKALLFLAAGAVIHSIAQERDMKKMGGLRKELPWTYWFMLAGVLGLIGIPILTNGGYSKEGIIKASYVGATTVDPMYWYVFVIAVFTAFLTALYAARMFFMIFHGKNRGAKIHKPKYIMRITIGILAVLVVATGFLLEGPLHNFLASDPEPYTLLGWGDGSLVALLCAIGAIVLGLLLAWLLYGKGQTEVAFVENNKVFKALRIFVANGYYIDHFYNLVFVKPIFWIGKQLSFFKTGKINWNMIFGSLVAIATIVILVVVMV